MEKITLTIKSDFGFAVSECVAKSGEIIITLSKIEWDEGGREAEVLPR